MLHLHEIESWPQGNLAAPFAAGQKVTEVLQAKVGRSGVRCETTANDQYNRKVL